MTVQKTDQPHEGADGNSRGLPPNAAKTSIRKEAATPQSVLDDIRLKIQRGDYLTRAAAELSAERLMDADEA